MAKVYLSLGSNIERESNIRGALTVLAERFGDIQISSVYESEAVGFEGDHFYNLVVGLDSDLSVGDLAVIFRGIESDFGRQRLQEKFSARTLDIDILTYGDVCGTIDGVDLPRDEIGKYAFVLLPMVEIAPQQQVPGTTETYEAMWQRLDMSEQQLWVVDFPL
jgi:2-amino-4-hydroxy-6-hydroxymethyldihydropteridine diphosphokinase